MLRLTAHFEVIDDAVGRGVDDVDRVAAAVGNINAGRKIADRGGQLAGVILGINIMRIEDRGHAGEGGVACGGVREGAEDERKTK